MDNNEVALAAITLAGSCLALIVWVVKKVLNDIAPALDNHTKAAGKLGKSVDKNTAAQQEVLTFMINLNGKLESAVQAKARGE